MNNKKRESINLAGNKNRSGLLFLINHKKKIIVGFILFTLWFFSLPNPLFETPYSTVIESREGVLLGARIADDGQWRFPKSDSIPYRFKQSIIHFEDEYFYYHPGFNPVSMAKALYQNMTTDKRRGGSTLTQQVIRLAKKNKKRTYFEKVVELVQATRLETGYSKQSILNLYASHAPFGGNVVGLETASWRYFGIPANELSWGQCAALAVLPNAPSLVFPGKNEEIFRQKRDGLLLKLHQKNIIDSTTYELSLLEELPGKPHALPDIAHHLTEKIKKSHPENRVQTTINSDLQTQINQIVEDYYYQFSQNQVHNMAVLVLDVDTREVIAYIGNTPTTNENHRFVDIVDKSRSTGSILKPLLYGSMLHSGEILPNMLVADVPTTINGYTPENFDKTFHGAVPASIALNRSLNVPAVRMLRSYGLSKFYNQLKKMNLGNLTHPSDYYGLSLILGGAESSLWEITKVYAGLASTLNYYTNSSSEYRSDEFTTPIFYLGEKIDVGKPQLKAPIIHAGAIYQTFESMKETNRPTTEENWSFYQDARPIAWKTGTSYGFKDAWAVGITPDYAIGIWVGNADGEGRPGLTGIQAAAPVLFDAFKTLPVKRNWFKTPFDELVGETICVKSGFKSGVNCDVTEKQWIPVSQNSTHPCLYHHRVFLDASESYRVNSSCYLLENMKAVSWFSLPPIQEYYYAPLNPQYREIPPLLSGCLAEYEKLMAFIFPKTREKLILPKGFDEKVNEVIFKLAHQNTNTTVHWYLDENYIGSTDTFHELASAPIPGVYTLTAVDNEGNRIQQQVEIIAAE